METAQAKTQTGREAFGKWGGLSAGHETEACHRVDRLGRTTCVTAKKMDSILPTAGNRCSAFSMESHSPICYKEEDSWPCGKWRDGESENLKMISG